MAKKISFKMVAALAVFALMLFMSPVSQAESGNAESDLQDAREFVSAMTFLESRGLDISNGIESKTGLWRLVIEEGDGSRPSSKDTVTVHATGWLADGTKFWSSHDGKGTPLVNTTTGFVPGFTEGLRRMKLGGKSLLVFPGRLGYGPDGNPGANIPPNATLIFEVELIEIQ